MIPPNICLNTVEINVTAKPMRMGMNERVLYFVAWKAQVFQWKTQNTIYDLGKGIDVDSKTKQKNPQNKPQTPSKRVSWTGKYVGSIRIHRLRAIQVTRDTKAHLLPQASA